MKLKLKILSIKIRWWLSDRWRGEPGYYEIRDTLDIDTKYWIVRHYIEWTDKYGYIVVPRWHQRQIIGSGPKGNLP